MHCTSQGLNLLHQWLQKLQDLADYYEEQQHLAEANLVRAIQQNFSLLMQQRTTSVLFHATLQRIMNFLSYRTSISLLLPELAHAADYQRLNAWQLAQLKIALFNSLQQPLLSLADFSLCVEQQDENDRLLAVQFKKLIHHLRLAQHLFFSLASPKKNKKVEQNGQAHPGAIAPLPPEELLAVSGLVFNQLHEMANLSKQAFPQDSLEMQAQRDDDGAGLVVNGAKGQAAFLFSIKLSAPTSLLAAPRLAQAISPDERLKFSPALTDYIENYQAQRHQESLATPLTSAYHQRRLEKYIVFSSLLTLQREGGTTPSIFHKLAADKPFLFRALLTSEAEKLWGTIKGELKNALRHKACSKKDSHGFFLRNPNLYQQLKQAVHELPSTLMPGQTSRIEQRQQLVGAKQIHHDKKYALNFLLEKAAVGELSFADLIQIKENFPRYHERLYLWGKSRTTRLIEAIEQDLTEQLWVMLGGEGATLCEQLLNDKSTRLAKMVAKTNLRASLVATPSNN